MTFTHQMPVSIFNVSSIVKTKHTFCPILHLQGPVTLLCNRFAVPRLREMWTHELKFTIWGFFHQKFGDNSVTVEMFLRTLQSKYDPGVHAATYREGFGGWSKKIELNEQQTVNKVK